MPQLIEDVSRRSIDREPACGSPADAFHDWGCPTAEQHRWAAWRYGAQVEVRPGKVKARPVVLCGILGPDGGEHVEDLVQASAPVAPGDVHCGVFVAQPAGAKSTVEPASGEVIQRGEAADEQHRVVPGDIEDAEAQSRVAGDGGCGGKRDDGVEESLELLGVGVLRRASDGVQVRGSTGVRTRSPTQNER